MFGIGFLELCIIMVVALVCVGPEKLPDLMKQVGKMFVQLRRMSNEVKSSVDQVVQEAENEIRQEQQKSIEVLNESSYQGASVSDEAIINCPEDSHSAQNQNWRDGKEDQTSFNKELSHSEQKEALDSAPVDKKS